MEFQGNIVDQVEYIKNLDISYRTLHETLKIFDKESNVTTIVPFRSFTNDYRDFFTNILVELKFEDYEKAMYRFNPKRLSNDLYDTTEFWNDILILNGCASVIDFDLPNKRILSFVVLALSDASFARVFERLIPMLTGIPTSFQILS